MTAQTTGSVLAPRRVWIEHWTVPLVPIALSVFFLSALAYYHVSLAGRGEVAGAFQSLVVAQYDVLGFVPAFMFWLLVGAWSSIWFMTGALERPLVRLGHLASFALCLTVLVNLDLAKSVGEPWSGAVGFFLASRLDSLFGGGAFAHVLNGIMVVVVNVAAFLLATDMFFYRYFEGIDVRGRGPMVEEGVENEAAEMLKELALAGAGTEVLTARSALPPADLEIDVEEEIPWQPPETAAAVAEEQMVVEEAAPEVIDQAEETVEEEYVGVTDTDDGVEAGEGEDREEPEEWQEDDAEQAEEYEEEEEEEAEEEEQAEDQEEVRAEAEEYEEDEEEEEEAAEEEEEDEGGEEYEDEEDQEGMLPFQGAEEYDPYVLPANPPVPPSGTLDPAVVEEAEELIRSSGRASASFLQRRLRIEFEDAVVLLKALQQRGVVELAEGEGHGRLL